MATGAWDVTSTTVTPVRAALGLTFAVPYLEVDSTLLVGPDSPLRSTADADRPGVRVAAAGGTGTELSLTALLRQAEVVRAATMMDAVALLGAGQVEAAAGSRANLLGIAARSPAHECWPTRYAVQEQRIALPPGRSVAALALASAVTRAGAGVRADPHEHRPLRHRGRAAGRRRGAGRAPRTGGPPPSPSGVALMAPVLGARRAVAQTMTRIVPAVT